MATSGRNGRGMGRKPHNCVHYGYPPVMRPRKKTPLLKAQLNAFNQQHKDQSLTKSHLPTFFILFFILSLILITLSLIYMEQMSMENSPKFITAYGPKLRVGLACRGPSLTKQSHRDECDINVILKRYEQSGVIPDYGGHEGRYLDCTGMEFQSAMEIIAKGRSVFAELPAAVRARFENDPAKMLDFVHDPANREEALAMGLLRPASEVADPDTGEVATPPASASPAPSQPAPAASA